jgi:acetyl-CoA carboxylase alpha subunit
MDPQEIADQLTLLDFTYFSAIEPREFLEMVWKRPEKEKTSLDMTRMLQWSKHVSDWLITEIVSQKDNVKYRVQAIEKIITIGTVIIFC